MDKGGGRAAAVRGDLQQGQITQLYGRHPPSAGLRQPRPCNLCAHLATSHAENTAPHYLYCKVCRRMRLQITERRAQNKGIQQLCCSNATVEE